MLLCSRCANCQQEAQFYCCWNTSYCDYPCQRAHWPQHFYVCTQPRTHVSHSLVTYTVEETASGKGRTIVSNMTCVRRILDSHRRLKLI